MLSQTKPNRKENVKYGSVFRTKDVVPHKYKQTTKKTCKIACKMQCLKNDF